MGRPSLTMQSLTLLLATTTSAAILPVNLNFGNMKTSVRTVKQCDGHDDDVMMIVDGNMPEDICMPGTITMDSHVIIYMDIMKLTPFPMHIPCFDGIGSCEYEACPMIEAGTDSWCAHFPETQPCSCPLLAGELNVKGVEVPVQDMGALGPLMEGGYSATMHWYGASDKDNILACSELTFNLKDC